MLGLGPLVTGTRPAPPLDEIARRVELQHRRRSHRFLLGLDGVRTLQDPHVILRIDGHVAHEPEHPLGRQLRPGGVHLKLRHRARRSPTRLCGERLRHADRAHAGNGRHKRQHPEACPHRRFHGCSPLHVPVIGIRAGSFERPPLRRRFPGPLGLLGFILDQGARRAAFRSAAEGLRPGLPQGAIALAKRGGKA